ncbi:NAD(P)H-binding protein [Roseovarius sp. 2305UL8-3]|uniref:NAD(P)H-binding protein n=1 Tax=Roseovarius conchicola TaxID=3121636 RepID=UPI003526D30A
MSVPSRPKRILVFGGTGTAGQAAVRALLEAGYDVTCFMRPRREGALPHGAVAVTGSLEDVRAAFAQPVDAVMSCLASRTGAPDDAWAIELNAHLRILNAAQEAGVAQFIQLSAICVQRPKLAFQQAKLAFEEALIGSDLTYSIVRPTAFFKSLSGQLARVQAGKPFLVFGDGLLTSCKPISDDDLGRFMASCLTDPARYNRILPIGGPGPAVTPLDQGHALFRMLGQTPRFRHVPVAMLDVIIAGLGLGGKLSSKLAAKADLARIGRYYATESMLVWDEAAGQYNAEATPEFGTETLFDFYEKLLSGDERADLGEHAVF